MLTVIGGKSSSGAPFHILAVIPAQQSLALSYCFLVSSFYDSSGYKGMLSQNEATFVNTELSLGMIALCACSFGAI